MSTTPLRPTPLQIWFGLLAGLASLAALQASLLPRWPRAQPLPELAISQALRQAGLASSPLAEGAEAGQGSRSLEFATSAPLAYRLNDGSELRLLRGTSRLGADLKPDLFASVHKNFQLEQSRLDPGPPPLTRGMIKGRQALQTCWVATTSPGGAFGVTWMQIGSLIDDQAKGRRAKLPRLIGLKQHRDYTCVLISLRAGSSNVLPAGLMPQLLKVLPAALEQPGGAAVESKPLP
jgi:hypothetical protein